jgi:WD40 repeat protein
MKSWLLIFFIPIYLFATTTIKPVDTIEVDGNIMDSALYGNTLFVGTDAGTLETIDWKTKKVLSKITYPKIRDFMGDLMNPKVLGVDYDPKSGAKVAQVQAQEGQRILYYYDKSGDRTVLIDEHRRLPMREVRFVDSNHLLIATMGNELILFDIPQKKMLYRKQIAESVFSDFQLDESHTRVASSCESGALFITDVKSGKILKSYFDLNKDNVFKIDFKHNHVLTCGKDKRAVIYNLILNSHQIIVSHFFIYAGGLSPDASLAAIQINEQNDIGLYTTSDLDMHVKMVGHQSTVNNIFFIDNKTIVSTSDDNKILIWRLP